MVSRRNYFSIILMMAVLFFIVMFSVIIKSNGNFYDTNEYIKEELPSGANQWISSGTGELVLFLGGQDEALKNIIKQWCTYTKRDLLELEQLEENSIQQMERSPSIILLDAKELKFE